MLESAVQIEQTCLLACILHKGCDGASAFWRKTTPKRAFFRGLGEPPPKFALLQREIGLLVVCVTEIEGITQGFDEAR